MIRYIKGGLSFLAGFGLGSYDRNNNTILVFLKNNRNVHEKVAKAEEGVSNQLHSVPNDIKSTNDIRHYENSSTDPRGNNGTEISRQDIENINNKLFEATDKGSEALNGYYQELEKPYNSSNNDNNKLSTDSISRYKKYYKPTDTSNEETDKRPSSNFKSDFKKGTPKEGIFGDNEARSRQFVSNIANKTSKNSQMRSDVENKNNIFESNEYGNTSYQDKNIKIQQKPDASDNNFYAHSDIDVDTKYRNQLAKPDFTNRSRLKQHNHKQSYNDDDYSNADNNSNGDRLNQYKLDADEQRTQINKDRIPQHEGTNNPTEHNFDFASKEPSNIQNIPVLSKIRPNKKNIEKTHKDDNTVVKSPELINAPKLLKSTNKFPIRGESEDSQVANKDPMFGSSIPDNIVKEKDALKPFKQKGTSSSTNSSFSKTDLGPDDTMENLVTSKPDSGIVIRVIICW